MSDGQRWTPVRGGERAALLLLALGLAVAPIASGASRFLSALQPETVVTPVQGPDRPLLFRWDFGRLADWAYTYEQEMRSAVERETAEGQRFANPEMHVLVKGALSVRSADTGAGQLVLHGLLSRVPTATDAQGNVRAVEQELPQVVIDGVQENGDGPFGAQAQAAFLRALFAMPRETLRLGETRVEPFALPFRVGADLFEVAGETRVTLTRFVRVEGRTCGELRTVFEASRLRAPPQAGGGFACTLAGEGAVWFDVDARVFVYAANAVLMTFDTTSTREGLRSTVRTRSDNFYRVRLR